MYVIWLGISNVISNRSFLSPKQRQSTVTSEAGKQNDFKEPENALDPISRSEEFGSNVITDNA
jgi:hypothetical protein